MLVVRQGGFYSEGVGEVSLYKLLLVGDKAGVVFAYLAVLVVFLPVDCYVAKDDADVFAGGDDFLSGLLAFAQEVVLFPEVAKQVAGDG